MRITQVYDPNGRGAELRVHRAGCADAVREARKATSSYTTEAASKREAAEDFYADFIDEGSMTAEDALGYTDFLPCTDGLPDGEAEPEKGETMTETAPTETTPPARKRAATRKPTGKVRTGDPKADRDIRDAEAARNAEVLAGVTTTEDKPATPRGRRAPAKTPARTGKTPATTAKTTATAKANGKAPASESGHRRYLTANVPTAMVGFTAWIEREFPEFGKLDARLVTVASKAYRYFQKSDLNR